MSKDNSVGDFVVSTVTPTNSEAIDAIIYWMKNPIMGKVAIDYQETAEQILINIEQAGCPKSSTDRYLLKRFTEEEIEVINMFRELPKPSTNREAVEKAPLVSPTMSTADGFYYWFEDLERQRDADHKYYCSLIEPKVLSDEERTEDDVSAIELYSPGDE